MIRKLVYSQIERKSKVFSVIKNRTPFETSRNFLLAIGIMAFGMILNCHTRDECEDSKKVYGIKKDNLCAIVYGALLRANKGNPNDLNLLLVANCIHPSHPSEEKCKNVVDLQFRNSKKKETSERKEE